MYYSCHCIKRNGLQHDCRRTGCGGEPACLHLPDPLCAPSQLARARGLADPGPLAAHLRTQDGISGSGKGSTTGFESSGKRFIVCELKGVAPEISADKSGKCCKCHPTQVRLQGPSNGKVRACISSKVPIKRPITVTNSDKCSCKCRGGASSLTEQGMFVFDEKTIDNILASFDKKTVREFDDDIVIGPGGRPRKLVKPVVKEPCTREGCIHWEPPPPCCWDAPCKADCFETPPGIRSGRNPLTSGNSGGASGFPSQVISRSGLASKKHDHKISQKISILTPECCSGCSVPGGGALTAQGGGGGPAAGLPVLVMKLC